MEVVEVSTGEVKLLKGAGVLSAGAIGSCIAVVAFDRTARCGGIAHVMLPGKARKSGDPGRLRYAEDAMAELFDSLRQVGATQSTMEVYLAGAGNVLQRPDDTVCASNISSVNAVLDATDLEVRASSLGGTARRRVRLHLPSGRIECAIGDGAFFPLNDNHTR